MQKEWQKPVLEVLNVKMTMAGPGKKYLDQIFQDEDETGALHHS